MIVTNVNLFFKIVLDQIRIETVDDEQCWLRSIDFGRQSDAHLSVSQPSHIESEQTQFLIAAADIFCCSRSCWIR